MLLTVHYMGGFNDGGTGEIHVNMGNRHKLVSKKITEDHEKKHAGYYQSNEPWNGRDKHIKLHWSYYETADAK